MEEASTGNNTYENIISQIIKKAETYGTLKKYNIDDGKIVLEYEKGKILVKTKDFSGNKDLIEHTINLINNKILPKVPLRLNSAIKTNVEDFDAMVKDSSSMSINDYDNININFLSSAKNTIELFTKLRKDIDEILKLIKNIKNIKNNNDIAKLNKFNKQYLDFVSNRKLTDMFITKEIRNRIFDINADLTEKKKWTDKIAFSNNLKQEIEKIYNTYIKNDDIINAKFVQEISANDYHSKFGIKVNELLKQLAIKYK